MQRGIQDAGALSLEKSELADVGRAGDRRSGAVLGEYARRLALGVVTHGGEHAYHRDRVDAARADVGADAGDLRGHQRRNGRAVEIEAAGGFESMLADRRAKIFRPVDHRRQAAVCGQGETHDCGLAQMTALDDGVGELRRADDHESHLIGRERGRLEHLPQRLHEPVHHIGRGRNLHDRAHVTPLHDYGVGIGTADIHPDTEHLHLPGAKMLASAEG